ncbi:MAG TPA: FecR domain-containing protein [Chryseolinea sp.]
MRELEQINDHIDELIGKYLAGEAVAEEIAFIESWASENESNRKYFDQFKTIFQKAAEVSDYQIYDTDVAWSKMKRSLHAKQGKSAVLPPPPLNSFQLSWRIAAAVILIMGVGLFLVRTFQPAEPSPVVVLSKTETVADTLPDGSGVVLNKQTNLAYKFDQKERVHTVKLKGEAYFNIHHDSTKTFIVDIDGVMIKDIGTSFNVKAYPESNTIEVVVESGEVMFYTNNDSGVYLRANGKGIYNKTTKTFTIDQPGENVLAYKTRVFTFSNSDLATVTEALNYVYDKEIVINDKIRSCHITVSFNNESQDEIVAIIAETLGLTVSESAGKIMLEGPGCEH